MARGFLTKTRQETGADKPKFGGGGNFVDVDAMVAREVVFGITNIEWDGENTYEGKPRPRWILDIIPWYEGEMLPGKADDNGRLTQLEAGKLSLASHQSRDDMMDDIARQFDEGGEEIVDGVLDSPGVLVKIRVPGGKGGRYTDLCEWDEENERPILGEGTEAAPDDEPRRPTGRSAPSRRGAAPEQTSSRRRPEPEPEPEPAPATRSRRGTRQAPQQEETTPARGGSSGFADAGGAESDGGSSRASARAATVPAPAGVPITAADLKLVSDVVGGDPYADGEELAAEYELAEGTPFPGIKAWLKDHGITDFPPGRGKIKPAYRDAFSIALRCWMEYTGRDATGQPVEREPVPGGPDHTTGYNRQPGRGRNVRRAEVPDNALEADRRMHPQNTGRPATIQDAEGAAQQPVRPEDKAAWLPPDEVARRAAGGPTAASEHVYEPNDIGDSVEPCPGCGVTVTARVFPSGGGSYAMMHECPKESGAPRPLQAHNIRKG